ncbi:MAG: AEC family transporter [Aggregatilineales bacterium]
MLHSTFTIHRKETTCLVFELSELPGIFINNIVPILLIAGVGYFSARWLDVPAKPVGSLIYYVFSPVLIFDLIYTSEIDGDEFLLLFVATVAFQLLISAVTYGALYFQEASPVERANVLISTFSLNAGNYGLALVSFAFGAEVLSRAAIVFVSNTILNYSFGVFVASNGKGSPRDALKNVLVTPALYAVVLAIVLQATNTTLPLAINRSVTSMAGVAIPLMLILLGIQLGSFTNLNRLRLVGTGVFIKLLIAPFIALGLVLLLSIHDEARIAFIMQASMPTAVVSIILTTEFDLDAELALNLIMVSTFLSPITLSILIAILT